MLLFHGCGGIQDHIPLYAEAAVAIGLRAVVVDSYGPRGWSRAYGSAFICTGARFWGRERAGDVLAAVWGVAQRPEVDASRLALAGWSHGAWSIMDLMTMPLIQPGEAALVDPDPAPLEGVRSLFLAYPYGGFGALSRRRGWVRRPEVLGIIPRRDHYTRSPDLIYAGARRGGCEPEIWEMEDGTHSFDEPAPAWPMRAHPALAAEARRRFGEFLERTLLPAGS